MPLFGRKARGESTSAEGWQVERRKIPAQLLAEAAANPGGGVAEIDGSRVPDPNGYIPSEAIRGYYTVDDAGKPTGNSFTTPTTGQSATIGPRCSTLITGSAGYPTNPPRPFEVRFSHR